MPLRFNDLVARRPRLTDEFGDDHALVPATVSTTPSTTSTPSLLGNNHMALSSLASITS